MYKKGDTLIEVIFAVAIFASVMIGGLYLMNKGVAKSQATLEFTMSRQAIDSQAEMLRFINARYISGYPENKRSYQATFTQWRKLTDKAVSASQVSRFQECNINSITHRFIIDPYTANIWDSSASRPAKTYARLYYNGENNGVDLNKIDVANKNTFGHAQGIWVEAVKPNGEKHYYDFHIRACWTAPGNNIPTTIGTIVRLYDPESN